MKNSALRWIWNTTGKIKMSVLALLLVQVVQGASAVCSAWLLRNVINEAVDHSKDGFTRAVLMFLGITIVQLTAAAFNRYLQEHTKSAVENRFKKQLFSSLMNRNYEDVTAVHSGEWMNRLTSDTVVIAEGVTVIVPEVCGMAVKLIGALLSIVILIPGFALFIIPGGILLFVLTYSFRKVLKKLHKSIQESDGRLRIFMSERLSSLMMVKIFTREADTLLQADERMNDHRNARMTRNRFSNICNTGFGIIMRGAYAAGAVYCGNGILHGVMNYGTFTATLQLINQVQSPFANMSGYLPKYYAMLASAERLMEAEKFDEDYKRQLPSAEETERFYREDFCSIVIKDLNFKYKALSEEGLPMPPVLENFSMELKKGDYAAFTGHSGCGKSTALKLIAALYKENSGEKYIETESGRVELDPSMRGLFSYVPQGNQLMSGSIREIVAFSDKELMKDDERIANALRISCADEFVSELADGADTVLGERGAGLSEGQMQRIAIARAVFSGHPILLLDEATSSLDEATEKKILENLRQMTDRTVIIVTHRPAALEICNKNIVFGGQ